MKDVCPCHNCPDRSADPNCHGYEGKYCPHGYLAWEERQRKRREERQRKEQEAAAVEGCRIEALKKIYKSQKRRGKT